MTSHRILGMNAVSTAACALGIFVFRGSLYSLFGLDAPGLLDALAVGLVLYAAALAVIAQRQTVTRQALMFFTVVDVLWVAGSAVVLVLFWGQFAPVARLIVIAAAVVVDLFATLQFRAAGKAAGGSPVLA